MLESSALELDNYLIIKSALDYFNFNTGIICKERTSEEDYVVIKCVKDDGSGRAGASAVGRQRNGSNILELTKGGFDKVTVLHELMHALGMYHEQSRPDRDNFIEIKWDNVKEAAKFNFQIEDNGTIRSNYDYCSIMQYNTMAFAINQLQPTIVCKSDGVVVPCQSCMGTGATLSQMDLDGLNNLYQGIGISRFPCKIPFVSANHTPQYSEKIEYLPVIGKRTITGYFTWNEYNMHYPTGESPEKIFGFVVQQPEGIIKQYKDIVRDNTPEYFSSQKIKLYPQIIMRPPVATTSYSKTAIVISYSVNFTISNLPENTPLSITPEIKLGFSPGETAITNKKTGEDESNFFVFIDDKTKYPLAYHNTSLNYPVSYSFIDRKSIKEKAATKYNAESKVLIPQNQPNPAVNQQKEIKQIQTIPVTQPAVTPKATRAIIHQ